MIDISFWKHTLCTVCAVLLPELHLYNKEAAPLSLSSLLREEVKGPTLISVCCSPSWTYCVFFLSLPLLIYYYSCFRVVSLVTHHLTGLFDFPRID